MQIDEKIEQKEAYLDALSFSPVSRDTLKCLHRVNDNTLDKWLYVPNRYPTFRACFELFLYLSEKNLYVSLKLHRLIESPVKRAEYASNMSEMDSTKS